MRGKRAVREGTVRGRVGKHARCVRRRTRWAEERARGTAVGMKAEAEGILEMERWMGESWTRLSWENIAGSEVVE